MLLLGFSLNPNKFTSSLFAPAVKASELLQVTSEETFFGGGGGVVSAWES